MNKFYIFYQLRRINLGDGMIIYMCVSFGGIGLPTSVDGGMNFTLHDISHAKSIYNI